MTEKTLHGAMAAAFAEIGAAVKDAKNPHFKSTYATLSAVMDAIKPALVKHGLFFIQHPDEHSNGIKVATVLYHASGESLNLGAVFVPVNKNDAQGYGSALSYARRYGLQTAFGVPAEDDDGNAAAKAPPKQAPEMDDADFANLQQLLHVTNSNAAKLMQALKINVPNLRAMNAEQAALCIDALETKLARMAKEKSNG